MSDEEADVVQKLGVALIALVALAGTAGAQSTPCPSGLPSGTQCFGPLPAITAGSALAIEPTSSAAPTPTPSGGGGGTIAYIGRTQGNGSTSGSTASLSLSSISGYSSGDFFIFAATSYGIAPSCPSGTTQLGGSSNSWADYTTLCYASAPSGTSFSSSGNWPKLIVREYHGVSGIDQYAYYNPSSTGSNILLSSLPATAYANDVLVDFAFDNSSSSTMNSGSSPSGQPLYDYVSDTTQWSSGEGDDTIASSGTVPPAETISIGSGNNDWIGSSITLHP